MAGGRLTFSLMAVLLSTGLVQKALGSGINGTLQEEFTCPSANCNTVCVGTGRRRHHLRL